MPQTQSRPRRGQPEKKPSPGGEAPSPQDSAQDGVGLACLFYESLNEGCTPRVDFGARAEPGTLGGDKSKRALNYLANVLMPTRINSNCVAVAFRGRTLYVGCNSAAREVVSERLKSLKELILLYRYKEEEEKSPPPTEELLSIYCRSIARTSRRIGHESVTAIDRDPMSSVEGESRPLAYEVSMASARKAAKNLPDEIKRLILNLEVNERSIATIRSEFRGDFQIQFLDAGGEHAEMKVLQQFVNERVVPSYVGISKLCCAFCERGMRSYFEVNGGGTDIRGFRLGVHGKKFGWEAPAFVKGYPYLQPFLGQSYYEKYNKLGTGEDGKESFWGTLEERAGSKDTRSIGQHLVLSEDSESSSERIGLYTLPSDLDVAPPASTVQKKRASTKRHSSEAAQSKDSDWAPSDGEQRPPRKKGKTKKRSTRSSKVVSDGCEGDDESDGDS